MSAQSATMRRIGVAVVLTCGAALPVSVWAVPLSSNPGQPFAEMAAQHDMIKQSVADVETNLGSQIQEVKDLLEALEGKEAPCGVGTEGQRFVVNGPEVCDNTTGLYWEQSPSISNGVWQGSNDHCLNLDLGNGQSYGLAEIEQLLSLVDYGDPVSPANALNTPNGPFSNVQGGYWSATPAAGNLLSVWFVGFGSGNTGTMDKRENFFIPWCVR